MPKATRFSPTYQRRRSYSQRPSAASFDSDASAAGYAAASPSAATASRSAAAGHKGRSMAYLRSRLSSSLHSPQAASPPVGIASESYLRLKKKGALTTWSTRYLVLRGAQLVWFSNKQDAQFRRGVQEIQYVESGKLTTLRSHELGLEIKTCDGKEYVARAFDRGDLAKWITAFHRLALKKEAKLAASGAGRLSETLTADSTATGDLGEGELELKRKARAESEPPLDGGNGGGSGGRHVSFHSSVLVRTIPTVSDDQIADLYYSREEMERFSSRASSLLGRTEEVMSCAYMAIRRPGSLSCRRSQTV